MSDLRIEALEQRIAELEKPKSKIELKGKKASILLDADAGGIWINPVNQTNPGDGLFISIDVNGMYCFGGYAPGGEFPKSASFVIGVSQDGESFIQSGKPSGEYKSIDIDKIPSHEEVY